MDSKRITGAQASDLANRIGPMAGYLTRLRDRMQQRAWAADDPVYRDVKAAQEALHRLHLTLRELERLHRRDERGPPPWEPGGSARTSTDPPR